MNPDMMRTRLEQPDVVAAKVAITAAPTPALKLAAARAYRQLVNGCLEECGFR